MSEHHLLPDEFRQMVGRAVTLWGQVIREDAGSAAYDFIEDLRQRMKSVRGQAFEVQSHELKTLLRDLGHLPDKRKSDVNKAFAFMLELINAIENAYRTHRLKQHPPSSGPETEGAVIFVLTAHPTEARSPEMIALFREIQDSLLEAFETGWGGVEARLKHLLKIAWRIPISRLEKPTVEDEARYIYSIVLRPEILNILLVHAATRSPVLLTTWVGGDKDGHPGVDARTMVRSLSLSRERILNFLSDKVAELRRHVDLIRNGSNDRVRGLPALDRDLAAVERLIPSLAAVKTGDVSKVERLHRLIEQVERGYIRVMGAPSPSFLKLKGLFRMFPGLVVPLELRESADLIRAALTAGTPSAIRDMLVTLRGLAGKHRAHWYVRGLVMSMTESADDIRNALKLVERTQKGVGLRVIPLFESGHSLTHAREIVEAVLSAKGMEKVIKESWRSRFEVMLGYSDSAKELGAFPSRALIRRALTDLDTCIRARGFTPVFFHGSGGSVDRGGGSLEEQIAWWPESAIRNFKATIQGEMVQRSFASPEIVESQIGKINHRRAANAVPPTDGAFDEFLGRITRTYQDCLKDVEFLTLIEKVTPYRYLDVLKFGSRPAKRGGELKISSLRAIPWILCWTQTRLLFPAWWGVGSAWRAAGAGERAAIARAAKSDPLFSSYLKLLAFTLAKVELGIFSLYLHAFDLDPDVANRWFHRVREEFQATQEFLKAVSPDPKPLWFRPWLNESIRLRSSMIHPLNILQILAQKEGNADLLRETVTGIASGMMTTG